MSNNAGIRNTWLLRVLALQDKVLVISSGSHGDFPGDRWIGVGFRMNNRYQGLGLQHFFFYCGKKHIT